jgi:uncharacterized protein YcfJ
MRTRLALAAFAAALVAGCVSVPTGPSMMVLPGSSKNFEQFRSDDAICREYAYEQIGGQTAERAQADAGVRSAAVGTLLGAAAGAAIDGGSGAAVGAGAGLVVGGLAGTGTANASAWDAQRRYDNGFLQCMYAKGHRIPVSGRYASERRQRDFYPPPPPPPPR